MIRVMQATGRVLALMVGSLGLLASAGCDLLEFAQNPSFTFQLPEQKFVIRTQDWKQPPPTFNMAINCATAADCCKLPPGLPPGAPSFSCSDYSLSCEEGVCAMRFPVEMAKTVNLSQDAPTLAQMKGKIVSDIVLNSLKYNVNNQLTMALPPVGIYLAPMGVTSMNSADAKHLTTVPMIPAGMHMDTAPLGEEGQRAFSAHAREFQTPFNFIASTTFVVRSGSPPPPMAEIQVGFTGTVTAKF